ncbi:MAG: gamma-glutamylcyclotransferase family protein [Frankiaceae bacterium]
MTAEPPLFVYGTLTVDEVLRALIGRVPARRPGAVAGWRAAALRGHPFPGLVPADGEARGFVLTDLADGELDLLDAFEGPAYERQPLELTDGTAVVGYVWLDEPRALADDWDVERFRSDELPAYLERCAAWLAGVRTGRGRPRRSAARRR